MNPLLAEINRLEDSIDELNAVIPCAQGQTLATFIFHRDWHIRILAGYMQALNASRS